MMAEVRRIVCLLLFLCPEALAGTTPCTFPLRFAANRAFERVGLETYQKGLEELRSLQQAEGVSGVTSGRGTQLKVHGYRTKKVVVLIHGASESPASMAKLVDPYHDLGYNVINVRLAGHGTVPEDLISTTPADMMKSVENAVGIAGKLGDRVVLAGHSAGAVLAAEYTAAHQGQIAGLDLYAPTFRFSTNMQKFIRARATQTWLSGLERETPTGYDRTSSAAYIRLLEHWDTIGPKLVGQKLGVPIRLTTTDRDIFADQESTEAFAQTNEIPQSQRVKYPRTNRAVNHNTLPATFDQPEVTAGLRIFDAQIR